MQERVHVDRAAFWRVVAGVCRWDEHRGDRKFERRCYLDKACQWTMHNMLPVEFRLSMSSALLLLVTVERPRSSPGRSLR